MVSSLEAGERMGAAGESGGMFQAGEACARAWKGSERITRTGSRLDRGW